MDSKPAITESLPIIIYSDPILCLSIDAADYPDCIDDYGEFDPDAFVELHYGDFADALVKSARELVYGGVSDPHSLLDRCQATSIEDVGPWNRLSDPLMSRETDGGSSRDER